MRVHVKVTYMFEHLDVLLYTGLGCSKQSGADSQTRRELYGHDMYFLKLMLKNFLE